MHRLIWWQHFWSVDVVNEPPAGWEKYAGAGPDLKNGSRLLDIDCGKSDASVFSEAACVVHKIDPLQVDLIEPNTIDYRD